MGSVLGLTAAAAIRWLNGGEFYLLPSGHDWDGNQRHPRDEPSSEAINRIQDQQLLLEQMRVIQINLEAQKEQQALILQRMQNQDFRSVTNDSMQVLLNQQLTRKQSDKEEICTQLKNILAELKTLREGSASWNVQKKFAGPGATPLDERLLKTVERIEATLNSLDAVDHKKDTKTSSESTSASSASSTSEATGSLTNPACDEIIPSSDEYKYIGDVQTPRAQAQTTGSTTQVVLPKNDTTACSTNESEGFTVDPKLLVESVRVLASENDSATLRVGAPLLYLYVFNLTKHPRVPRYRKIFTCNESFQKVDRLKGGRELLAAVGFVDSHNALEWLPVVDYKDDANKDELEKHYLELLKDASAALHILKAANEDGEDLIATALSAMKFACVPSDGQQIPKPLDNLSLSCGSLPPGTESNGSRVNSDLSDKAHTPPQSPIHCSFLQSARSPPPPPPITDILRTPEPGMIASPPAIKHAHTPTGSSFHFGESPLTKTTIVVEDHCIQSLRNSPELPPDEDVTVNNIDVCAARCADIETDDATLCDEHDVM